MNYSSFLRSAFLLLALVFFASPSHAYNRRYVYSYEAGGMPQGLFEFEPWFTYEQYSNGFAWEFRNELEYAVTDSLIVSAYLSDWSYSNIGGDKETTWKTAGFETLYTLTDPTVDWLGSAVYTEVLIGPEKFALEAKLILHKNFGPLSLVYNGILEAEWEGPGYSERVGVLGNTIGASYQFNPKFFLGFEGTHEVELADWSQAGQHAVYMGPNVSFRTSGMNQPGKGSFFASLAALVQVTNIKDEPESQIRLIVGYFF
jgi:hypothetical protein